MDLPPWAQAVFATLGGSLGLALLWLLGKSSDLFGKLIDKKKEPHEVMEGVSESLRETIKSLQQTNDHQSEQIHGLEKDVGELRKELRKTSIQFYELTLAVNHCASQFPDTAAWWAAVLKRLDRL